MIYFYAGGGVLALLVLASLLYDVLASDVATMLSVLAFLIGTALLSVGLVQTLLGDTSTDNPCDIVIHQPHGPDIHRAKTGMVRDNYDEPYWCGPGPVPSKIGAP